jgi:hypothetical protein
MGTIELYIEKPPWIYMICGGFVLFRDFKRGLQQEVKLHKKY